MMPGGDVLAAGTCVSDWDVLRRTGRSRPVTPAPRTDAKP
jgi:hypothetical protein